MASAAGIAPATSTFARWRSDLTELRGQNGIRDRTCTDLARLERPAARAALHSRTEMAPEVGSAPTSPRLQRGANLPQLLGDGSPNRSSASEGWSSRQVMLLRLPV